MRTPRSSKSRIGKNAPSAIRSKQPSGTIPKTCADYGCLSSVTVHGVAVILIAAKNLTWLRGTWMNLFAVLRMTVSLPARERLRVVLMGDLLFVGGGLTDGLLQLVHKHGASEWTISVAMFAQVP